MREATHPDASPKPRLIIVAYAVAPGPGGPEGHVNAAFLRALAEHWPAGVTVISGGDEPVDAAGVPLSQRDGWEVFALGECGAVGAEAPWLSRTTAGWRARRAAGGRRGLGERVLDRLAFETSGFGLKMNAWRQAARRALAAALARHPDAVVQSRVLPWAGIAAVHDVRKTRRFPWLININDPLPADVWPGLYASHPTTERKTRRGLETVLPLVDGLSFPSRDLAELERCSVSAMGAVPSLVVPHLTRRAPTTPTPGPSDGPLEIAFAGTLRKTRINPAFREALETLGRTEPGIVKDLRLAFHLARPNPSSQGWIADLPVATSVTVGQFDDALDRVLEPAAALLDLEAEADRPLLLTKVVNYLGYGRPLLALCVPGGTTSRLLERGGGWAVPHDDAEAILGGLRAVHDAWRQGRLAAHRPADEVVDRFGPERQVEDLAALIARARAPRTHEEADLDEAWP